MDSVVNFFIRFVSSDKEEWVFYEDEGKLHFKGNIETIPSIAPIISQQIASNKNFVTYNFEKDATDNDPFIPLCFVLKNDIWQRKIGIAFPAGHWLCDDESIITSDAKEAFRKLSTLIWDKLCELNKYKSYIKKASGLIVKQNYLGN